ncbi:MAG: hypothetical protein ACR2JU_10610 [Nocardioidaceae bacterium]
MTHVEVDIFNRHCVYVRGRGVRAALVELTGRAPCWSPAFKAFVCSERTARGRLIPWFEHRGVSISVTGPRATAAAAIAADNVVITVVDDQVLPW